MARFKMEEADNYGTSGSNFFSLKEDRESARVRFLINDINDLFGVSVHEVDDNGNKYDVECLRTYNEPVDNCPLCAAGKTLKAKLFIPIYNEDEQKVQVWSRGKTYFDKMSGLCSRYGNPLVAQAFDIERHGKKGDQKTTYEIYPVGQPDHSRVEDFPECPIDDVAFKVKTFDELQSFVNNGSFENNTNQRQPVRNNNARQVPIRRTPTRTEEDNF